MSSTMSFYVLHIVLFIQLYGRICDAVAGPRPTLPPFRFPVSNNLCPVLPLADRVQCGTPTLKVCEGPAAGCDFCKPANPNGATALTDFKEYVGVNETDVKMSALDYYFFKAIELEYTVAFMKDPLPWEKKEDLPFCGLPESSVFKREIDEHDEHSFGKRKGFPSNLKVPKKFPTLNDIKREGNAAAEKIDDIRKEVHEAVTPPLVRQAEDYLADLGKGATKFDLPGRERPQFQVKPVCLPTAIQIPIHFSVFVTNTTTAAKVSFAVLEEQVRVTNEAYKPMAISYFIASINYHIGEEFRKFTQHDKTGPEFDAYARSVKSRYRYGGNDEVNIWLVERIGAFSCPEKPGDPPILNGYCTPAGDLTSDDHDVDGCVVVIDSLPGVQFVNDFFQTGSTLTHELGHWLNLRHVFPSTALKETEVLGCKGSSDFIADTFQFPNDMPAGRQVFEAKQTPCCPIPGGRRGQNQLCTEPELQNIHVANYMSYSRDKGNLDNADPLGTRPWTSGQRVMAFTSYFVYRRGIPDRLVTPSCDDWIVYPETFQQVNTLNKRALTINKLKGSLFGKDIQRQAPKLRETLRKVCSAPIDPKGDQFIDMISGEQISCKGGSCQLPASGASCPDGTDPPCALIELCPDNSKPPCQAGQKLCEDGTAQPCTIPEVAQCVLQPPGVIGGLNTGKNADDGKNSVPSPIPNSNPNTNPNTNITGCPQACDVHFNTCDALTAPTCIFPNPLVTKPRAACACRPGFKASAFAAGDVTKQWRLPILGQEHRVWVAEGVKCDIECTGSGVNACQEISVISEACVG